MQAKSEFDVTGWDQNPYESPDQESERKKVPVSGSDSDSGADADANTGPKLSRATVEKTFRGDLEGTSSAELLMCQADTTDLAAGAGYVASEVVTGELNGKRGSFVIQHWGLSGSGMEPKTTGHVVPGSGTHELVGLTGIVEIAVSPDGKHALTMEYELPDSD